MKDHLAEIHKVLHFWFEEITPKQWWEKNLDFDKNIKVQFLDLHEQATKCELYSWRKTPQGRLAEIIVLDQFSRNIYRGRPESFMSDPLALTLSQEAISLSADKELSAVERSFLYMPFMHSESKIIHEKALELFADLNTLEYEIKHKKIIDQFGRYPHRNEILGRISTVEEIEFLKGPGSSF
jgi:uncharacterized protein (DUF924 family)